jgi:putative ABC transport system permease protein
LLVVHLQPSADPLNSKRELEDGLRADGLAYDAYLEDALLREYGAALNDLRSLSALTTAIAIVAVVLGSHNLAWLAAEERSRSLGILRAIGFERRTVGGYLVLRGGVVSVASYALALAAVLLFLSLESGIGELSIGGAQVSLDLNPATVVLGLLLVWAAGLAGTWLSVRRTLNASPATLLGRGPGSSFA